MTIGQKLHQTLAALQGAAGDLKSYALDTQDQNAKTMFADYANQLEGIVSGLRGRINYVEQQEPPYKVLEGREHRQQ